MTTRHPLTMSLTPELADFVAREVRGGQYTTASEVVRAGLRRLAKARGQTLVGQSSSREAQKHVGFRAIRKAAGLG